MTNNIELTIIGNLAWNGVNNFLELTDGLTPECFTSEECASVFMAMQRRAERGESINDPVLLYQELATMGREPKDMVLFCDLLDHGSHGADTREYIKVLIDSHYRKTLHERLQKLAKDTEDMTKPVEETMSRAVEDIIATSSCSSVSESRSLYETLGELMKHIDDNISGRQPEGMLTGLRALDQHGGLHGGNLVVMAAESSQGKTALALTIMRNATEMSGVKAVMYSMEMSAMQLTARLVSRDVKLPASVIMYNRLNERDLKRVDTSINNIGQISESIFFDEDSVSSLDKIQASIRLHVARHRVRLVVIDYLQIINLNLKDYACHELAIAEATRKLQRLSKELDICIILLSQLSRDTSGHLPSVDRLRGSGQINEAADLTMLIYRPSVWGLSYPAPWQSVETKGTAMLRISKDRFGAYGGVRDVFLRFDAQTTTFYDMDVMPEK